MYDFVQVASSSPRQMEQEHIEDEKNALREPQLFGLGNFVEDDMTLVSDSLYSRDTVSLYIEKNQKFIKFKRFTVNTVKAEGKVDISKKLKVGNRCPVYNENHDIEDCVFF